MEVKNSAGQVIDTIVVTIEDPMVDPGSSNDRCIATGMAIGLPFLLLIPIGLASQVNVPGLDPIINEVNRAIGQANAEIQQQVGIWNPQLTNQINAEFAKITPEMRRAAAGVALVAAGLLAAGALADACGPGEGSSEGSSDLLSSGSSGSSELFGGSSESEDGFAAAPEADLAEDVAAIDEGLNELEP